MKINFTKQACGILVPASDIEAERMKRFKSGEIYEAEIKLRRNSGHHGKMFAFFNFCFEYWSADREFLDQYGQFDLFRKNLTVLAGYYDEYYTIDGSVRLEAKSLSYDSMSQETFSSCYNAIISAAMKHVFPGCGEEIENRLLSFF